jgi:hypothetical protein
VSNKTSLDAVAKRKIHFSAPAGNQTSVVQYYVKVSGHVHTTATGHWVLYQQRNNTSSSVNKECFETQRLSRVVLVGLLILLLGIESKAFSP